MIDPPTIRPLDAAHFECLNQQPEAELSGEDYARLTQEKERRARAARLSPVACAECGKPVAHMTTTARGALAGGMCTSDTCVKDRKTGRPKRVYTYMRIATE